MGWMNYNWVKYDKDIQHLGETSPKEYPWDMLEPKLWAECVAPSPTNNQTWSSQEADGQEQGW